MNLIFYAGLIAAVNCLPQDGGYSGQVGELDSGTLENIGDIFGTAGNQNSKITDNSGYGSEPQTGQLQSDDAANVLIQVVQETNYVPPDDYVEPSSNEPLTDKATTEINTQFENCADYTETLGYECVPYYQCHNGTIIVDGAGLIDIRNGFGVLTPEDSKCPGFLDVCCKDPDFVPPPPPKIRYQPQCGRRNQNGLGVRIQGFNDAESQFGEWPHMCAVLHEKIVDSQQSEGYGEPEEPQVVNLFQCGGSLIAPGVILTAAHCVDKFRGKATELKVRCGEWDTQNQTEPYPHQDRKVQDFKIHPLFNPRSLASDWAVLFTSEEFELSSHIDTTCLPQAGELFDGQTCFATGWGKDKFGSAGEYQVVLKEIDLPVVDFNTCQNSLRATRLGKKFKLDPSFICAGGIPGRDTCKGDGGSPLVCESKYSNTTYVQAGIVAWGIGCGETGTPGVYASVSQAVCWIDYVMSCYYGNNQNSVQSYWGSTSNICQPYMDNLYSSLSAKRDGAPNPIKPVFQGEINQLDQCSVAWEVPAQPLTDVSGFERDSYADSNAEQVKGDDGYSEPLTNTQNAGDGYTDENYSEPLTNTQNADDGYTDTSGALKNSQEYK